MRSELQFNIKEDTLEDKITEFKSNEENISEISQFVDGVLEDATVEAQRRIDEKQVRKQITMVFNIFK